MHLHLAITCVQLTFLLHYLADGHILGLRGANHRVGHQGPPFLPRLSRLILLFEGHDREGECRLSVHGIRKVQVYAFLGGRPLRRGVITGESQVSLLHVWCRPQSLVDGDLLGLVRGCVRVASCLGGWSLEL